MTEFDNERKLVVEKHNNEISDLQDIMFSMDQNFKDRENEAKSDFQSTEDEIRNKVNRSFDICICMYNCRVILKLIFFPLSQGLFYMKQDASA